MHIEKKYGKYTYSKEIMITMIGICIFVKNKTKL